MTGKQGSPQKFHTKNRCDEGCKKQRLLIQKFGESPAQIAVNVKHKSAGIVSEKDSSV
ncbi:MAG: hypothetical protein KIC52_05505 [Firmicutes bacterium]|nr:hypothetical protein [Bacillota bacterium]